MLLLLSRAKANRLQVPRRPAAPWCPWPPTAWQSPEVHLPFLVATGVEALAKAPAPNDEKRLAVAGGMTLAPAGECGAVNTDAVDEWSSCDAPVGQRMPSDLSAYDFRCALKKERMRRRASCAEGS